MSDDKPKELSKDELDAQTKTLKEKYEKMKLYVNEGLKISSNGGQVIIKTDNTLDGFDPGAIALLETAIRQSSQNNLEKNLRSLEGINPLIQNSNLAKEIIITDKADTIEPVKRKINIDDIFGIK